MGLFDKCKPLIGVVHLPPLPGSLLYKRRPFPYPHGARMDIDSIVEYAVSEAKKYSEAGFDAIIIENFGDKPYKMRVGVGETASIVRVVGEVKRAVNIPVGVNLLRNSGYETLYAAHISGASFVRVNSLCELRVSVEGIMEPAMRDIARALQELDIYNDVLEGRLEILADINVKHSKPFARDYKPEVLIKDCLERSGYPVSALIVTGESTGVEPPPEHVESVARIASEYNVKTIVGSGVKPENIAKYWHASDGFIVGTSVKLGEYTENVVSLEKARTLSSLVERYRQTWPCKPSLSRL